MSEYCDWRIFEISKRMSRIFQSVNLWVGEGQGNGEGDQDASKCAMWGGRLLSCGGGPSSFSTLRGMAVGIGREDHNILCSLSYLSSQWCGEGGYIAGTK